MRTLSHSFLVWLPLAAALAQTPPRDLDPLIVAQSNPYPPRGDMFMLAVDNGLAVGALSSGWLAVLDVHDTARPRWRSAIPGRRVSGLVLSRGYLLAIGRFQETIGPEDQDQLAVFDLVNPDRPTQVAGVGLQDHCALKVAGSLGFLIYGRHVEILDLSDVTHPKAVDRYDVTGGVADVAADGGLACILEYRDPPFPPEMELHVLDVADPPQPRRLGGVHGYANWYSKVFVRGRQVFLTHSRLDPAPTYQNVITILDLTDPAQPARIAELDIEGGVDYLAVARWLGLEDYYHLAGFTASGNTVFEGGGPALHIYDGTDPANLRRVGGLVTGGRAWDLAVVGRYALVAEGASGLQIIDVADPNNARRVGEAVTSGDAVAMEVEGDLACVLAQHLSGGDDQGRITLELFDVSRLPAVTRLGSYQTDRLASSSYGRLAFSGHRAYLAGRDERPDPSAWLEIVDVSHPAAPSRLGLYRAGDWTPTALAVRGEYVVVASESGPTEILDVSAPSSPRLVSRLGGFAAVALADTRLYATDEGETQVIDLGNPAAPRVLSRSPIGGRRILAAGTRAFVLSDNLAALDVSDPTAPRLLDSANLADLDLGILEGAALDQDRVLVMEARFFGVPGPISTTGIKVFDSSRWALAQHAGWLPTHGSATSLAIEDTFACVTTSWSEPPSGASSGMLELLDLSDPVHPRRVGGYDIGTPAYGVDLGRRRAYVALGAEGLEVADVSDPAAPRRLGGFRRWQAGSVAVSGNHAFVADGKHGLLVVDVSNAAKPWLVGEIPTPHEPGDVVVSGQYAYVATSWHDGAGYRGGFNVFDVSEPANPRLVGTHDTRGSTFGLTVSGDLVYLTKSFWDGGQRHYAGLEVVKVADPANPVQVGVVRTAPGEAGVEVAVSGDYLFLTTTCLSCGDVPYRGALNVYDVSDPTRPDYVGGFPTDQPPTGVTVSGRHAYVATQGFPGRPGNTGLQILDISDPRDPRRVGGYAGHTIDVTVVGSYAYLVGTDRCEVLDVSDPTNPRRLGEWPTAGGYSVTVTVSGRHAYVADGRAGLQIVDLSDPTHPRRSGGFLGWDALAVSVRQELAYVADRVAGLRIVDVSDPAKLRLIAEHPTGGTASDVTVKDQHAYVACGEAGLLVLDISDPSTPRQVATYAPQGSVVHSVTLDGTLAYLTGLSGQPPRQTSGLEIIDLTDPANPRRLGAHPTSTHANRVRLAGRLAYVACAASVEVFDVSDPTNPRRVGDYWVPGVNRLAVLNDRVLVTGKPGMTALNPFLPLQLNSAVRQPNGIGLSVSGPLGWPVRIQRSADLMTWQDWQTVTLGATPVELADPDALSQSRRFYRTVAP